MTDKLSVPNPDTENENTDGDEKELDKIYPCLANVPREDWEGVLLRAKREGVPVDQLKLRKLSPPSGFAIPPVDRDLPGILDRTVREGKPIQRLQLRGRDNIRDIYESTYFLLAKAGFPVREYFEEGDDPVSKRFLRSIPPAQSDEDAGNNED